MPGAGWRRRLPLPEVIDTCRVESNRRLLPFLASPELLQAGILQHQSLGLMGSAGFQQDLEAVSETRPAQIWRVIHISSLNPALSVCLTLDGGLPLLDVPGARAAPGGRVVLDWLRYTPRRRAGGAWRSRPLPAAPTGRAPNRLQGRPAASTARRPCRLVERPVCPPGQSGPHMAAAVAARRDHFKVSLDRASTAQPGNAHR